MVKDRGGVMNSTKRQSYCEKRFSEMFGLEINKIGNGH